MKKHDNSIIMKFYRWSVANRFLYFVSSFGLLVLVLPMVHNLKGRSLITTCLTSILIIIGIFSTKHSIRKNRFEYILFLGVITLFTTWLFFFLPEEQWTYLLSAFSTCLFFGAIITNSIKSLMLAKEVTVNLISAAITIYIMIGFLGAMTCKAIYTLNHDAFFIDNAHYDIATFIYFSFMTLTTVGYGDILPKSMIAKFVAMYIAIIGQLYLTVVISMLIGKYLNATYRNKETASNEKDTAVNEYSD